MGFRSPDSDYGLRGLHVLPPEKVVGLVVRDETVGDSRVIDELEMDIASHDVKRFLGLLLKEEWLCAGAALLTSLLAIQP